MFSFIVILFGLSPVVPQTVNINCNFRFIFDTYTCDLAGIVIPDNENVNIIIGGIHNPGMNNNLVGDVILTSSITPFIITQMFTTFPQLTRVWIGQSELQRIQPNAFANAGNLRDLVITGNYLLHVVPENAFTGATNLRTLDLWDNNIENIHEAAFTGLSFLGWLALDSNQISQLHVNVFRPLTSIANLEISDNRIESIDGRLFETNSQLIDLRIARNGLNAIGRNFLEGLANLWNLVLTGNRCIDRHFLINGITTIETVRQELTTCFNNFEESPGDYRRFALELRGSLVLRHENGSEIIRI